LTTDFGRLADVPIGQSLFNAGGVMPKLTDYVKTAEAAEFFGAAQTTLRKRAYDGVVPTRRSLSTGYRPLQRSDLERFLRKADPPVPTPRKKSK
jgi:hypothetical protein